MPGSRSGTPLSAYQRTADPYSLTWSTVWLAPVPRSSGGRSAVSRSRPIADSPASMTAGWRLAAAVPDVHTTATGRPLAFASPRAVNDAERSSIRTCNRTRPARSSASNAIASGVDLDPGATTTSRSPHRASSSASTIRERRRRVHRYRAAASARSRHGSGSVSQRASAPGSTGGRRTGSCPPASASGSAVTSPSSRDIVARPQA